VVLLDRLWFSWAEIGNPKTSLAEMATMFEDTDMGLFVIDRAGVGAAIAPRPQR